MGSYAGPLHEGSEGLMDISYSFYSSAKLLITKLNWNPKSYFSL